MRSAKGYDKGSMELAQQMKTTFETSTGKSR